MILTKEQTEQFLEASKPLMKFLAENFHPHVTAIVVSNSAEILESSANVKTDEFIPD